MMLTNPDDNMSAAEDGVASLATWEELASQSSNRDDTPPAEEVLILDMKVTFNNSNINNENNEASPLFFNPPIVPFSATFAPSMNEILSGSRGQDPPLGELSADKTIMSATISELSFQPSDVSTSSELDEVPNLSSFRMDDDHQECQTDWKSALTGAWAGSPSHTAGATESFWPQSKSSTSSAALTPLLEPFAPPLSRHILEESGDTFHSLGNTAECLNFLEVTTDKHGPIITDTITGKQEYGKDAFVKIANFLDNEETKEYTKTESNENEGTSELQQQEATAQENEHGANMNSSIPSANAQVSSNVCLLWMALAFAFVAIIARHPKTTGSSLPALTGKAAAVATPDQNITMQAAHFCAAYHHNFNSTIDNDSAVGVEMAMLKDWQAWNMTTTTSSTMSSLNPGRRLREYGSPKSSPTWCWKMSFFTSLLALAVQQFGRRKSRDKLLAENHGFNDVNERNATKQSISFNHTNSFKHESVIFCPGESKRMEVKVELIHHATSDTRQASWTCFDLSSYTKLRVVDLKELLRQRRCKVSGLKRELVARLVESYALELGSITVKELRERLRNKGLKVSGRKQELVQRLVEVGML